MSTFMTDNCRFSTYLEPKLLKNRPYACISTIISGLKYLEISFQSHIEYEFLQIIE